MPTETEIHLLKQDLENERALRTKLESMLALNAKIEAQFVDGSPEKMVAEIARLTHEVNDLKKDRKRLEWLLPRQFNHQTRESIDSELDHPQ